LSSLVPEQFAVGLRPAVTYVDRVMQAAARRAAFVAAVVGLLAALSGTSAATAAPNQLSRAVAAVGATADAAAASARSAGVASDAARPTSPVATRTSGVDRAPSPHLGAGVAALLLVLAACLLAVGLRRLQARSLLAGLAGRAAPRAPPVAALPLP
jgi:hypothetical protein